jgi:pullulanase/glycogen debranching enzyme
MLRWDARPKSTNQGLAITVRYVIVGIILSIMFLEGIGSKALRPDGILDRYYSSKELGCVWDDSGATFRVFAPRAWNVLLMMFDRCDQVRGRSFPMKRDADGVWELHADTSQLGRYYGYKIRGPAGKGEMYDPSIILADPYSRAVCSKNHYSHSAKSLILREDAYDWEGDDFVAPAMEDLIIYEAHVRDLTAHPSSGVDPRLRGTYPGLVAPGARGGINHLRSLGINALELLPCQDFANIEVPYRDSSASVYNTWNPYARNHWGYMTSYFFAPETYYATG